MITVTMQILNEFRDYSTSGGNIKATAAQWDTLYGLLAQDDLARGYNVILNQNGEMLDRDPVDVAATIRQATGGLQNVWIDYCVWPMRHRSGFFHFYSDSPNGFAEFIHALNPRMAIPSLPTTGTGPYGSGGRTTDSRDATAELTFQPPWTTSYPYKRGLSVNENPGRAPWADDGQSTSGWWVNDRTPSAVGEQWEGFPQNTYSCFAFRYGAGYYFWAYGADVYVDKGVDATAYAEFIHKVLAGQAGTAPDGGFIGPPAPPPFIGPPAPPPVDPPPDPGPPSVDPPLDPGPPPPDTQPPIGPASGVATWWAGLSRLEQAAIVGGGTALLAGAVILMYQTPTPGRTEG